MSNQRIKRTVLSFLIVTVVMQFPMNCLATPIPQPATSVEANQLVTSVSDVIKDPTVAMSPPSTTTATPLSPFQPINNQLQSSTAQPLVTSTVINSPTSATVVESIQSIGNLNRGNKVEKLKRGLSSFLTKNNPASFFVPNPQQVGGLPTLKGSSSSAADSTSLINADPSTDSIIKSSTRMTHNRPIGGPLRWG